MTKIKAEKNKSDNSKLAEILIELIDSTVSEGYSKKKFDNATNQKIKSYLEAKKNAG